MRNFAIGLLVVGLFAGLSVTPSWAAKGDKKKGADTAFTKLDADGDGKISQAEFEKAAAAKGKGQDKGKGAAAAFKKLDKDGDGFISKEEFAAKGDKKKKNA